MTKTHDSDLCERIRELEKRLEELERRPAPYWVYPWPYTAWPTITYPYSGTVGTPAPSPTITYGTVTTGTVTTAQSEQYSLTSGAVS